MIGSGDGDHRVAGAAGGIVGVYDIKIERNVKTSMIRNPFKKDDIGCSFVCCMGIQALVQLLFFSSFMQAVLHEKDHYRPILIQQGKNYGYKYDPATDTFDPKLRARDQSLDQKDHFFDQEQLKPAM